jgi:hypothetical protein
LKKEIIMQEHADGRVSPKWTGGISAERSINLKPGKCV